MKRLALISLAAVLGGCFTSITSIGQNHYSMSKTSAACGFRGAGGVKNDLFEQASELCAKEKRYPELISVQERDGVIGQRCASADIEFRCVDEQTDLYKPTNQKPDKDMNHSANAPASQGQFGPKP